MTPNLAAWTPTIIAVLIGVAAICAVVWAVLRKAKGTTATQASVASEIELARLNERLAALQAEGTGYRATLQEAEGRVSETRAQLALLSDERARLDERASRVPALEDQVKVCQIELVARRDENSRVTAQLAERTEALVGMETRLGAEQVEHKADLGRMESLRGQLQEEIGRVATLAEQSSRVPALERTVLEQATLCEQLKQQIADLRENLGGATSTGESLRGQTARLEGEVSQLRRSRDELLGQQEALRTQLAETATTLEAERTQNIEKLALLNEAKDQLADHFKSLANDILEEKTRRFTDQNKENMGQILEPLRTKLQEFQGKVEEVYVQEGKDRSALAEQVRQLMFLNQQLSAEANSLTQALKGSSNTRGSWGELILERVLESSGLRKGEEYDVKESVKREDGTRGQPDVVIHLPESKELVIDSKVSLIAYEEYTNAETDRGREVALARHVDSVRTHIKELSDRNYQTLYGLKSLDCVVMFVPVEPAFILAVSSDTKLWEYAWRRNVLLVCPSTLLFVLRTVAHIWRQEQQNRNVQEIAKRGGELYDKFTGFLEELHKLGERLKQAQDCYDGAIGKFEKGRGNLIRQAEMLRSLGVKPTKCLPEELIDAAFDDATVVPAALPENSDIPVPG
jgi:DNA recombination protein RmuC